MNRVSVYEDQIKLFVIVNNDGLKITVDVNAKNFIDKGECDNRFIQNPSNCECECDKSCDTVNIQIIQIVSAEKN